MPGLLALGASKPRGRLPLCKQGVFSLWTQRLHQKLGGAGPGENEAETVALGHYIHRAGAEELRRTRAHLQQRVWSMGEQAVRLPHSVNLQRGGRM
uniref:Uncharacterized protein n=1 Tax=Knipowitschia caucasica TaxID=637954 RepID=A0AAV2KNR4_KNICA